MQNYNDKVMDFLEEYYQTHGYPPLPCDVDLEIDPESNEVEDEN